MNKLIASRGNGLVKIITGVRRCGKSFLLFTLWHDWLVAHGVEESHIIGLQLDDLRSRRLRNPEKLLAYVDNKTGKDGLPYYVMLDEVQLVDDFVEVVLSLLHSRGVDVYVSGSNSRFLSSDVVTEFRGRGQEIRVWPLSFGEYFRTIGGDKREAWLGYYTYGGLPQAQTLTTAEEKSQYLRNLYETTYLRDVVERNSLRNVDGMRDLIKVLASGIGAPTNPKRIANTFQSEGGVSIKSSTIRAYIEYLKEAFLIEEALRYDVKGRKYIGTETKYYFSDVGVRAAILGFRQQEETHIMENIIYNELRYRGFNVDVGMIELWEMGIKGRTERKQLEVDFVVNQPPHRVYVQSAYRLPTVEKQEQERRPLLHTDDHFRKIIITGEDIHSKEDEQGITTISLLDFLLDSESI